MTCIFPLSAAITASKRHCNVLSRSPPPPPPPSSSSSSHHYHRLHHNHHHYQSAITAPKQNNIVKCLILIKVQRAKSWLRTTRTSFDCISANLFCNSYKLQTVFICLQMPKCIIALLGGKGHREEAIILSCQGSQGSYWITTVK